MSNFPSVRPSLNLQFDSQPTPEDMTSHLASVGATFSRASVGTYTDANGLIAEASAGQARPNYSSAGVHEGLLIEESRTNLYKLGQTPYLGTVSDSTLRQGGAYGSAYFTDVVVDNGTTITDGTGDGFQFDVNATTGDHTFSFIVKGGNGIDEIRVRRSTVGVDTVQVLVLDLTDGTLDLDTLGATVIDLGSNTYYVAFTDNANASSSVAGYYIKPNVGQTCDGVNFFSLAGLQAEAGSFATSYIPTIPTFSSRASTATYFDSDGELQTASIDEARTDHKYIDGEWVEAGLLLEGASTNLLAYSEDATTTNWNSESAITVTTNAINAPDGNTTADLVAGTATTSLHYLGQNRSLSSSTTYTQSAFVKAEALDYCYLLVNEAGSYGNRTQAYFNLSNGTLDSSLQSGDFTLVSTDIVDVSNGWYRISMTFTTGTLTAGIVRFGISDDGSTGTGGFLGDGSGVYMWGFQLEAQSQPTSYIATSGAEETRSADVYTTATKVRSADVCKITGTTFTDFYNEEEGTIFTNAMCEADSSASRYLYSFNNTISTERVLGLINSSDEIQEQVVDNGGVRAQFFSPTITLGSFFKNGFRYKKDSFNQVTNGIASTPDTAGNVPTPTQLNIASSRTPAGFFNGYIKKFIYFPRALTDNELIKLTQ